MNDLRLIIEKIQLFCTYNMYDGISYWIRQRDQLRLSSEVSYRIRQIATHIMWWYTIDTIFSYKNPAVAPEELNAL